MARGRVVNALGFGDSITEGQGTYIGEGWGFPACMALSANAEGVAYEWSNLGWSGADYNAIRGHVLDAAAVPGLVRHGDVVFLAGGTPNGHTAPDWITPAGLAAQRAALMGLARQRLDEIGAFVVPWTWLPTDPAVKAYGVTDALRRAFNDELRSLAARGMVVADFDVKLAGAPNGDGQVLPAAETMPDTIHPGDSGNALLALAAAQAIERSVRPAHGLLAM